MQTVFLNQGIKPLSKVISRLKACRVFLVASSDVFKIFKQEIQNIILPRDFFLFEDFEVNPKYKDILKGINKYHKFKPDVVVALGGGTTIDVAKAINFLAYQSVSPEALIVGKSKDFLEPSVPLIAMPTTAGTGSEETSFSVVYIENSKHSLTNHHLKPNIVIADSSLIRSMPAYLAGCTGLDALTQAVESLWSRGNNTESFKYAKSCIRLILDNLEDSINQPKKTNLESMVVAANLSGKAINITKTTVAHALSYSLTSNFNIPHGHAVAFLLPPTLFATFWKGNNEVRNRINTIFEIFDVASKESFLIKWKSLMKNCALGVDLKKYDVKNSDADLIASEVNPERMSNHPVEFSSRELRDIIVQMVDIF